MESGIIKIDVDQIKEEDLQRVWKEAEHLQWKGPESSPLPFLDVRHIRIERYNFANKFETPDRGSDH